MEPILALKHIDKRFAMVHALKDVSLDVFRGETIAVVGENGAGKSTLMKILTGAYQKDTGEIYINGNRVEINTPAAAKRAGVSQVYQQAELIPELSVAENIFLGEQGFGKWGVVNWRSLSEEAQALLDKYEIGIDANVKVKSLNVANRQLAAIAKILLRDPAILIFDEPTAVLSDKEVEILFRIISRLKEHGKTILYISHRLEEVFQVSDRIAVMRDGSLIMVIENKGLTKQDLIVHMLGRQLDAMFPPLGKVVDDTPVLELQNVTTDKVDNISFILRKGEILGLTGLVGSGRTELARAIFGIDRIRSGRIMINGKPEKITSPTSAMQRGIFLAPEDRKNDALVLIRPIRENVTLSKLRRVSKNGWLRFGTERALVDDVCAKIRVAAANWEVLTQNLSGGNQQKVVISKAIATRPNILIFDEPTQGIDVGAKSEIYSILEDLRSQGISILFISSEIEEVRKKCDRILVMRDGGIVGELEGNCQNGEQILNLMYRSKEHE